MITNDEQLEQTRKALNHLETALASLKQEVLPLNPQRFVLMAEPVIDQIKELRQNIDEYIGLNAAVSEEASVWMRIKGAEIELDDAPTSIVTSFLNTLRLGVQTVAEFVTKGEVSARPTAELKQACDLRIVAWQSGSVQVGLRLPDIDPSFSQEARTEAEKALNLYLKAAAWVGSENETSQLESDLPDPKKRQLLLNQVARLVPRPQGGVEFVELFSRDIPKGTIKLKRESRERIRKAIEKTVKSVIQEELLEIKGFLREIDLDERTFILRNPDNFPNETRCKILPDSDDLLETAKDGLDHKVLVIGNRQKDPTRRTTFHLQVLEIEVLEKSTESPEDELMLIET